jgi:hypothetical protein
MAGTALPHIPKSSVALRVSTKLAQITSVIDINHPIFVLNLLLP